MPKAKKPKPRKTETEIPAAEMPVPRYVIMLSLAMVVALCDIDEGITDPKSPAQSARTLGALGRRGLISHDGRKLTTRGKAYLQAALAERNHWLGAKKVAV